MAKHDFRELSKEQHLNYKEVIRILLAQYDISLGFYRLNHHDSCLEFTKKFSNDVEWLIIDWGGVPTVCLNGPAMEHYTSTVN